MSYKKCLLNWMIFSILIVFSMDTYAKNGIYLTLESGIGIQSGLLNTKEAKALYTDTRSFPSAYRAGIGYNHDLLPCLGIGLDIGKGYYGEKTYGFVLDKTHIRSRTLEFLLLLQLHWRQWDVISKIGGLRKTMIITGHDGQDDQTQIALVVSAGIAYNVTANFAVLASYAHVLGDHIHSFIKTNNKSPRLSESLIGIRYTFGSG